MTAARASEDRDFCLANARLVLEDRVLHGAIEIRGAEIVALSEGAAIPDGATDCGGDYVLPGLIELHTDNLERHMEPRPGVVMPHKPAILAHDGELASVGITTVFDALRVGSILSDIGVYRKYARDLASEILQLRDAGALRVRHALHLRAEMCSDTLLEELAEFGPQDHVRLLSIMDHTPGQRQFRDLSKLKTYFSGKYNQTDAQFEDIVAYRQELGDRVRKGHETASVAAAVRLGATMASHDDTTAGHVERSHALGIRLAEFPTTLEAAQACHAQGIQVIMGAPNLTRGGSHSGNVSAQELAKHGLLDIVSSDYAPSLLLSSAFKLAEFWGDLPRAVCTVTTNPAKATGLHDRGRLQRGCLADLVRVQMLDGTPVTRAVWRGGIRIG